MNGIRGLSVGRPRRGPQEREKLVEPRAVFCRGKPVPGREQFRPRFAERLLLVVEHLQRKPGVQLGIVPAARYQRSVLVMLDQMVIRIAGEGQRIQPKCVHRGQVQQPQAGIGRPQMGQVESDQVVPQQEVRAIGQVVQLCQCLSQIVAHPGNDQGLTGVRPHSCQGVNSLIRPANFQVQRQTSGQDIASVSQHRSGVCLWRFHAPRRHVTMRFPSSGAPLSALATQPQPSDAVHHLKMPVRRHQVGPRFHGVGRNPHVVGRKERRSGRFLGIGVQQDPHRQAASSMTSNSSGVASNSAAASALQLPIR